MFNQIKLFILCFVIGLHSFAYCSHIGNSLLLDEVDEVAVPLLSDIGQDIIKTTMTAAGKSSASSDIGIPIDVIDTPENRTFNQWCRANYEKASIGVAWALRCAAGFCDGTSTLLVVSLTMITAVDTSMDPNNPYKDTVSKANLATGLLATGFTLFGNWARNESYKMHTNDLAQLNQHKSMNAELQSKIEDLANKVIEKKAKIAANKAEIEKLKQ